MDLLNQFIKISMKTKIDSLATLQLEIDRLKSLKAAKDIQLKQSFQHLSNELKPVNLIKSTFNSITKDNELKSQIQSKGLEAALGFVVTNLLFKNANPMIRTAATLFGTTFASKLFGEDSANIIGRIKNLYQKIKEKSPEEENKPFDEGDIYKG